MGSADKPRVELRAAMLTDVGVVRDHNEDAAYVDPEHEFFVVADGMGGHAAGEVASAMAVDTVRQALEGARATLRQFGAAPGDEARKEIVGLLEAAVRAAHQAVFDRGTKESDKQGMGTTLDVAVIAGTEAFVAHVGDSRTYLLRDGKASQITTDHTVAEVLVIEGKLTLEEAQVSPLRTILVNAIGVAPDVGVEMAHLQLRAGDRLLLCSDGLHDYFPSEEELARLALEQDPDEALAELTELAKQRGGHDNVTGVLLEILTCEPPAETSDSDGVPAPIARDDTLPVDVGAERSSGAKSAAAKASEAAVRKTEPMATVPPAPDGGGDDDDDDDDGEKS